MTREMQLNINNIMQGLALAGILWVGTAIQDLKTTVALNDYRLDQIEQKAP